MTLEISNSHKRTIEKARKMIILNSNKCIESAITLFEQANYPHSCFFAMTSIEECGKLFLLEKIQHEGYLKPKRLNKYMNDHFGKAVIAAINAFMMNSSSVRRQGEGATYGIARIAISKGKWMEIRNSCMYSDFNVSQNKVISPEDMVSSHHAYYFISMALEIIAELSGMGLDSYIENTYNDGGQFWVKSIEILNNFMNKWIDKFDIQELGFINDPKGFTGTNKVYYGEELSGKFSCIIDDILGNLEEGKNCDEIYVG